MKILITILLGIILMTGIGYGVFLKNKKKIVNQSEQKLGAGEVILVGRDSATTANGGGGESYFYLYQFTAATTGTVTEIHLNTSGSGNVKVSLYADTGANQPGGRLAKQDSSTAINAGVNIISLEAGASVTSGTKYWLGWMSDTGGIAKYSTGDSVQRYKLLTYSTFVAPDPAGTGFSSDTYGTIISAYGTVAGGATATIPDQNYQVYDE